MAVPVYQIMSPRPITMRRALDVERFQISFVISDFIKQAPMGHPVKNAKFSPPTSKMEPALSAGKYQAP